MPKIGSLEVVCGSMFSGKSEELIRRMKRALLAGKNPVIFKPAIDKRYSTECVCSHDGRVMEAVSISYAMELFGYINEHTKVVGIDEVQFLDDDIEWVIKELVDDGIRVIVSGLDMDFTGEPFGLVPRLMAQADHVTKLQAICTECGDNAVHSARLDKDNQSRVDIGEFDKYVPLCRSCYKVFMKNRRKK